MAVLNKSVRFLIMACFSLLLLYCGVGMVMAMTTGRMLPAFPFSWVDWLDRPYLPRILDHVVNFLLASMLATLLRDLWRVKPLKARRSSAVS